MTQTSEEHLKKTKKTLCLINYFKFIFFSDYESVIEIPVEKREGVENNFFLFSMSTLMLSHLFNTPEKNMTVPSATLSLPPSNQIHSCSMVSQIEWPKLLIYCYQI